METPLTHCIAHETPFRGDITAEGMLRALRCEKYGATEPQPIKENSWLVLLASTFHKRSRSPDLSHGIGPIYADNLRAFGIASRGA